MKFSEKEYKKRLNECIEKTKSITLYNDKDEIVEIVDLQPLVEEVFKAGWDAYRAVILEASYL